MFKKGTKFYSIFNNKCPRCHEGDFFVESNIFKFKNLMKLHEKCPQCDLKYMMEPSFFYGAMYVNYALTVALSIATFIIVHVFIGLNLLYSFLSIIAVLAILTPLNIRLGRSIWINIFVKYQKDSTKISE